LIKPGIVTARIRRLKDRARRSPGASNRRSAIRPQHQTPHASPPFFALGNTAVWYL